LLSLKLARKTAALTVFNVFVRSFAVGRELVVAWVFGVTSGIDAYVAAALVQTVVTSIIVSSYSASVLPVYVKVLTAEGEAPAGQLLAHILRSSVRVLCIVLVGLALVGYPLLALIFHSSGHATAIDAYRIMIFLLPIVLFAGIASILSAVLNANGHLFTPTLLSLTTPAVTIVSILLFSRQAGVTSIATGFCIGQALEMTMLLAKCRKLGLLAARESAKPLHLKTVYQQALQMAPGAAILSATAFVDNMMAAKAGPGGIALLAYGGRIVLGLQTVLYSALATSVFPLLSQLCAQKRWFEARSTILRYAAIICSLTCIGAAIFALSSEWLVRMIYLRGNFTEADAHTVTTIQRLYVLQCPFYLCSVVFVRSISALHRNWVLGVGAVLSLALNVCSNLYFARRIGLAGVPITGFLMYFTSTCFLLTAVICLLRRRIRGDSPVA
jgi:putative peptidoglycan lipid II flippase